MSAFSKIIFQRQLPDLGVHCFHIDRRTRLTALAENISGSVTELSLPIGYLTGVHLKLLREFGQRLLPANAAIATFALKVAECFRLVPFPIACSWFGPFLGVTGNRFSTLWRVQFFGATSELKEELLVSRMAQSFSANAIYLEESDEFLAEFKDLPKLGIRKVWAKTPQMAARYKTLAKAKEISNECSNASGVVGMFDTAWPDHDRDHVAKQFEPSPKRAPALFLRAYSGITPIKHETCSFKLMVGCGSIPA